MLLKRQTVFLASRILRGHSESRKLNPFPVTGNHFYTSLKFFLPVINNLVLKLPTGREEPGFAEGFSRMFSAGWHCVKRLHSSFPCCEL